jgi:hypothetical protein
MDETVNQAGNLEIHPQQAGTRNKHSSSRKPSIVMGERVLENTENEIEQNTIEFDSIFILLYYFLLPL